MKLCVLWTVLFYINSSSIKKPMKHDNKYDSENKNYKQENLKLSIWKWSRIIYIKFSSNQLLYLILQYFFNFIMLYTHIIRKYVYEKNVHCYIIFRHLSESCACINVLFLLMEIFFYLTSK